MQNRVMRNYVSPSFSVYIKYLLIFKILHALADNAYINRVFFCIRSHVYSININIQYRYDNICKTNHEAVGF